MQEQKIQQYIKSLIAGFLMLALAGCALGKNQKAVEMKRLLAASGFKMHLADTPRKLDQLQKLPQRKLISQQGDGKVLYVYADAAHCKCLYVGSEAAYQRYQKLALEKQVAEEDRIAEKRDEPVQIDRGDFRFDESW